MPKHTKNFMPHTKGFTLMELMIVVTIIGIIAAFAIPNYNKSVEREHEKDAIQNLQAIHDAQLLYRAKTGSFWAMDSPTKHDINDINSSLNINVIENGFTYECVQTCAGGCPWSCTAQRDTIGYIIFSMDYEGEFIRCCSTPHCPTLGSCGP